MDLNFVEQLPKQATADRANVTRDPVLEELVEALADQAGVWAVYPWQLVRPDLAELGVDHTHSKVVSHVRQIQSRAKRGEYPFNEYVVEVAVRKKVGFIRVKAPNDRTRRGF